MQTNDMSQMATKWESNTLLSGSALFLQQLSALQSDKSSATIKPEKITPPASFDGINVWQDYMPPIKNQCNCGGCWAFATSACLASRINIWTRNRVHVNLSPAKMIYCNWGGDTEYALVKEALENNLNFTDLAEKIKNTVLTVGCSGETLIGAWQYIFRYGVTTESCHPYSSKKYDLCKVQIGQPLPSCEEVSGETLDVCADGSPERQYRAGGFYIVSNANSSLRENELSIQKEIWKYGPVTTGMKVYDDLFEWDGKGVYQWNGTSTFTGGHAVVILGWGSMNNTPFWQVRNTWGKEWGDNGNFRILRGQNHCDIEMNVVTGFPEIPLASRYMLQPRLTTPHDIFLRNVWPYDYSGYNVSAILNILQGLKEPKIIDPIYESSMIPNFKSMIAGKPSSIMFPYATSYINYGLLFFSLTMGIILFFIVVQMIKT